MTKIINISIDKLIGYELNNKTHNEKQINLLCNSIKEYWFNTPIIIDKDNIIIAGHWRLEASKKLWLKDVPCIIKDDLTEIQVKKYRLLDNKIAELAEDNEENIKLELQEINDFELAELYWIDLDIDQVDDYADGSEDDIPDVSENVIVEKWDIF